MNGNLALGINITFVGITVVFLILIFLASVISLLKVIFSQTGNQVNNNESNN